MSDLDEFIGNKKANSTFLTLEDGESVVVKLQEIKLITKTGFGGEEKEVVRLKCEVETTLGKRVKDFDNGTQRFAQELKDKAIVVGATFKITRTGLQTKTRYTISDVRLPGGAKEVAPATPVTPAA